MPDIYVDTDVAPGGVGTSADPYASFSEAWAGESANLAAGETWNFFCAGTAEDNVSLLTIGGYASGVTAINIYPWHVDFGAASSAGDGWYQGGANWSTSHYRMVGNSNTHILQFNNANGAATIRVQGIQFEHTSNSSGHRCISLDEQSSGASIIFSGCRFKISGTGAFPRGIRAGSSSASCTLTCENNLLTYDGTQNMSAFNLNDNSFDARLINNTVVYGSTGGEDFFDDVSGCAMTAYNNVAYAAGGTGDIEFDSAGTLTSDYNASIVAADRGANGFAVATADFTSYGVADADDLTPATSQTNAWGGGGITNGAQSLVPTTDIRGNARNTSGSTAMGAFAATGEGAGGTTVEERSGSAAGDSTATGSGGSIAGAAGTASGSATVSSAGGSIARASGASSSSSAATASAAARVYSTGTASGTSTASGAGAAISAATGTATSVANAAGNASAIVSSAGSAAAAGTASGDATAIARSSGTASGAGVASGTGGAVSSSSGTASGSSTATGSVDVSGAATATGTASGVGAASAAGGAISSATGSSAGQGTATGSGVARALATGTASDSSTATGAAYSAAFSAGSTNGDSTASAQGGSVARAAGVSSGSSSAAGDVFQPPQVFEPHFEYAGLRRAYQIPALRRVHAFTGTRKAPYSVEAARRALVAIGEYPTAQIVIGTRADHVVAGTWKGVL